MAANRIHNVVAPWNAPARPKSQASNVPPGFVLCPPQLAATHCWQQAIYRLAYERAKADAEVPRPYRIFFSNWN